MKKTGTLPLLPLITSLVLVTVACAPSPAPLGSVSDEVKEKKKTTTTSSDSTTPGSTSTTPPAGTGADGENGEDGGEGDDPNEAANEAKFLACLAKNPAAKTLADQMNQCFESCEDTTCETECETKQTQTCQSQQALCTVIFQCEEEAFPEGEGEEGEGEGVEGGEED